MNKPSRIGLSDIVARLDNASRIVITTHTRADGDAVGSAAALQRVLRQLGKTPTVYLHEPVLERYAFLAQFEPLPTWNLAAAGRTLASADLLLLVDTCAAAQLGKLADPIKAAPVRKVAIDHHVTRDDIVDEVFFSEEAGASAQIVVQILEHAGWPIDGQVATALFTGLATDTGWFRFANADRAVFVTGAKLIKAGASPVELYERLYLSDCAARARLIGAVLSSFELLADGRLAVIRITQDMLNRCGATREMTEEIINEPQRIGSVIACVLIVEPVGDGPVRVSFRSKHGLDVAAIAAQFGGGGHERAAGARIPGTFTGVAERIIPVMIRAVESIR
ncbi:MAG TPA: bifunctional oligoribonuclease/PAP phosphatase NrnA [Phycisphaerae bacterium]|nr:bifunctional oligoribonuclease/PAP phosphatase NrnA [Phycisphaerae bacterium]